ncbi:MAG: ribonuclease HII [Aureispira sp.]
MLQEYLEPNRIEAGCDEAGRGCLAGAVFAAAVILPPNFEHKLLKDSKQMTKKRRELLREVIEAEALTWAVAAVDAREIEAINILNASILAMHRAVKALTIEPEHLLIDGNRFHPYEGIEHSCLVKGDQHYLSIAAASVLAKTHRDEYMQELHERYPNYGWNGNKGYPTKEHRQAVVTHGSCIYHRSSFSYKTNDLELTL